MIREIEHPYLNVVAFEFLGEVTKSDFSDIIIPKIETLIKTTGEINLVYLLSTDLNQFTLGAWWKDAMLGLHNITKWHKSAIVTDRKSIQKFTEIFSHVMPGEFKGFNTKDLTESLLWASTV